MIRTSHQVQSRLTLATEKAATRYEVNEAVSLKRSIEKFSFICILVLQTKILERTNTVSQLLQAKDADLSTAVRLLNSALTDLTEYRDRWAEIVSILDQVPVVPVVCSQCFIRASLTMHGAFYAPVFCARCDAGLGQVA